MEAGPAHRRHAAAQSFTCPIPGCCRHSGGNRPGWGSFQAMRAHLDMHLVGELEGRPSDEWLPEANLTCCRVCGRSISTRVRGGIHPSCWRDTQPAAPLRGVLPPPIEDSLPSEQDIFETSIRTKDFIPAALIPMARAEYAKLVGAVLQYNRPDAWDPMPVAEGGCGIPDSDAHKGCS